MKKEISYLVIVSLTFVLSLGLIKFYQQESFKTNVKNKVFEECFNYYNRGAGLENTVESYFVGANADTITSCINSAGSALDK